MKAIFRAVIKVNYSRNDDNIDYVTLRKFVEENNVLSNVDFDEVIKCLENCLERLIHEKISPEEAESVFDDYKRFFSGVQIRELVQVWAAERENVHDFLRRKNSSGCNLLNLSWNLHLRTYAKTSFSKNINEPVCILNMNVDNRNQGSKAMCFEVSKSQVDNLYADLQGLEETLEKLLASKQINLSFYCC
eukprot:TRINITY_DN2694_c0_g2_i2.p2 TRINITY_DN2694_c0_g2~~TRINITY_DN2694_c0_g2_i2.p2  ORF type:complete len:190 (+),score=46.03 TRINITY_DN2694_c0_g2_i2:195-764(+)